MRVSRALIDRMLACKLRLWLAPLLVTAAGCPAMFRGAVVNGIADEMHRQSDEQTYLELRQELEEVEQRPIVP
ncbi:MAG: hypothetical protein KDA63_19685 [Planctomycetales bacterium]|nr:hypothetical protein [Planctomycetales bacterium]